MDMRFDILNICFLGIECYVQIEGDRKREWREDKEIHCASINEKSLYEICTEK